MKRPILGVFLKEKDRDSVERIFSLASTGFDPVQAYLWRPVNPAVDISPWIGMCTMRVTRRNEAVVTVYVTSSCLMWSTLTTRLQFLGDMKVWRTQRMTVHSLAMLLHVFVSVPPSSPLVSQFATRFSRSMDRLRSIRCNDDVDGNRSLAKFCVNFAITGILDASFCREVRQRI